MLAELGGLLCYCKGKKVVEDIISVINVKTISYVKKCKKQKSSRNVQATKRYLKEQKLFAIRFDKGVGICLMKQEDYEKKLGAILELPQFEKVILARKNAKHPVISEQESIISRLKELRELGKIDNASNW